MTQKIPLQMINESNQIINVDITDRKFEIHTTSLATPPNSLPPLGKLVTVIADDEVLVWKSGEFTIRQESDDNE